MSVELSVVIIFSSMLIKKFNQNSRTNMIVMTLPWLHMYKLHNHNLVMGAQFVKMGATREDEFGIRPGECSSLNILS